MGKNILTSPATDIAKENAKNRTASAHWSLKRKFWPVSKDIVYELREYQPTEQFDERKAITEQLESLTGKEERIKASYREGIDTLEEYKANKAIIQKERESLEQQLKDLKKAAHKSDQNPADAMLQKVRSVYDILISNNYTYVQKNEALKQIIDKIIYDRKNDSLKIYFFLYR